MKEGSNIHSCEKAERQPHLLKERRSEATYTAENRLKTASDDDRRKTTTATDGKMTTAFLIF